MINCIDNQNDQYDKDRIISNARFDYKPELICYCTNEDEVKVAIARAVLATPFPGIRIRAGGHHHEGMCSGNDVMMIDVSKMDSISVNTSTGIATVGPGAKNGDIYEKLWNVPRGPHRVFPGGGCGDVRVGGFLQGGGWGPYSRLLGMACDRVTGFRIVLANGEIWDVDENDPDPKRKLLYWCVLGAGGGNFGVVTEYRIRTESVPGPLSTFTVSWDNAAHRLAVMEEWRKNFPGSPVRQLTSFCRVSTPDPNNADPPVLIGGNCFAGADEVVHILEKLLPNTISKASSIRVDPVHQLRLAGFTHPEYQPGPPPAALQAIGADKPNLADTCAGNPFPHMVSSCFPSDTFGEAAMVQLANYIAGSEMEGDARRYLSLHSMGGAIDDKSKDKVNCFAWRHKPFMLQYQAWWANPKDNDLGNRCMNWLRVLRDKMRNDRYTEGSFINFPDAEIDLQEYYGKDIFGLLKKFIENYDKEGVFFFPMGIPRPPRP